MKECPVCSHENSDDATSCSNCGSELDPAARIRKTVLDESKPVFFESDSLISNRYRVVRELGRRSLTRPRAWSKAERSCHLGDSKSGML